jgi:sodium transport system permease protein
VQSTGKPKLIIYMFKAEFRSETAADKVEDLVGEYRKTVMNARIAAAGLPATALTAIETKRENVAAPEKVAGSKLAIFLPYMIIVLCLSGAIHPAMDLTAGEKERGTMETLLASAVGRRELVIGKFLMVLTVSLISTTMALSSYLGTAMLSKDYGQELTRGHSYSMGPAGVFSILLLVLPLAILFSSLLLALSIAAKSYKEAQQQIGPLMIFAFLPAMVGMIPGIDISPQLAFVPVLNVSLVAKDIFSGVYHWPLIGLTFLAMCIYAWIALSFALSRFQNESVMFRS